MGTARPLDFDAAMFGLEILFALILKFWTILYGLVYGSISSLPRLHRSLLARQLKVEWNEAEYLIVQSADRDLHIADLTVMTLVGKRGHIAYRERVCTAGSSASAACCRPEWPNRIRSGVTLNECKLHRVGAEPESGCRNSRPSH